METIQALQIDKISDENQLNKCHGDKDKRNFYNFDNIKPND